MLELPLAARERLVAHCVAALPLEGCGLLVGDASRDVVVEAVGTRNAASSALVYEIEPSEHLRIDRAAESRGLEVLGAFHSHTHTDAWPSPTDVAAALVPSWHWVLVSLRHPDAVVASFRILGGTITQEELRIV